MLGKRYVYDGKAIVPLSKRQLEARKELLQEMRSKYRLINVSCECGSDRYEVLSQKDRYGLPVTMVICKKCGLIYQNPRLDDESSKGFYQKLYRKLYETSTIQECFNNQYNRGKRIIYWLCSKKILPRKVVEIGCGAGGILKAFQNYGAEVFGVDFDEDYINYGRSKGLKLEVGGVEKVPHQYSDCVILSHVLEHFSNMQKELDVIHDLLSPKGWLYVELPGIFNLKQYSYDFLRSLQNAHNFYFTLGTLEQTLSSYGWELVHGDESIRSLFKYSGNSKGVSKNYYSEIKRYLIWSEKVRCCKLFTRLAFFKGFIQELPYMLR